VIDPNTVEAQNVTPSWWTRLALLITFVAAFCALGTSGQVTPPVVAGLILLVVAAQAIGHPAVLGPIVAKLPTPAIALGFVLVAIYVTLQYGFTVGAVAWCAALFVLCIDWNTLARLPLPLLLTLLLITVALTRGRVDAMLGMLVIWTVALVATLALMERDSSTSGRRLDVGETGSPRRAGFPVWPIAVIAVLLLVLVPLLAMVIPQPNQGRPNRLGDLFADQRQATPYWGFEDRLDTSTRGKLNDEVVMRVQADAPDYWRGTSFDAWDGRTWTRTGDLPTRPSRSTTVIVRPSSTDIRGGTPFRQVFTIEKSGSDLVFGAYRMAEVEMAEPATVDPDDGTVRAFAPMTPGSVYTVISHRKEVTADRLRNDDPLRQPLPPEVAGRFLTIPNDTPDRVRQLGRDITDPQPTTYDKVTAVGRWMRENTEYSQDTPPLPAGADGADQHLFVDRKGDCDQIATSSAVMLRSVGIPTRLAVGFIPGERNALTGEYTVRAKDAHAWIEVWFPGTGWQAFDPTAEVPLAGEFQPSTIEDLLGLVRSLLPWLALLGGGVVIGLVVLRIIRRVRELNARRHQPWAAVQCQRLLRAGTVRDRPRRPHETLLEYATALSVDVFDDDRLIEVGKIVSRSLFSAHDPTPEERMWAEATLAAVEKAKPPRQVRKQRRLKAKERRRHRTRQTDDSVKSGVGPG